MRTDFSSDFYSTAAEVLPVLFLVAIVEFRLFVFSPEDVIKWVMGGIEARDAILAAVGFVCYVLTMGLGEGAALHALQEEQTFRTTDALLIGALVASVVAFVLAPALNSAEAQKEHVDAHKKRLEVQRKYLEAQIERKHSAAQKQDLDARKKHIEAQEQQAGRSRWPWLYWIIVGLLLFVVSGTPVIALGALIGVW